MVKQQETKANTKEQKVNENIKAPICYHEVQCLNID